MNVVVVCNKLNKKTMKEYLPSKKHNINVLGIIISVKNKDELIRQITEVYNPHALFWVNGVPCGSKNKEISELEILTDLKKADPNLKIFYSVVNRVEIDNYDEFVTELIRNGIYNIITGVRTVDDYHRHLLSPITNAEAAFKLAKVEMPENFKNEDMEREEQEQLSAEFEETFDENEFYQNSPSVAAIAPVNIEQGYGDNGLNEYGKTEELSHPESVAPDEEVPDFINENVDELIANSKSEEYFANKEETTEETPDTADTDEAEDVPIVSFDDKPQDFEELVTEEQSSAENVVPDEEVPDFIGEDVDKLISNSNSEEYFSDKEEVTEETPDAADTDEAEDVPIVSFDDKPQDLEELVAEAQSEAENVVPDEDVPDFIGEDVDELIANSNSEEYFSDKAEATEETPDTEDTDEAEDVPVVSFDDKPQDFEESITEELSHPENNASHHTALVYEQPKAVFENATVNTVAEQSRFNPAMLTAHITVAVSQLIRRTGCTHVSVELASFLKQKYSVGVVFSDNETYLNFADYLNVECSVNDGFKYNGVSYYSPACLSISQGNHEITIKDFGIVSDDELTEYEKCPYKLLVADFGFWNVSVIEKYIVDSAMSYVPQTYFLFNLIGENRFTDKILPLAQKEYKVFRLSASESCFEYSAHNAEVYGRIFNLADAPQSKKKQGLFKRRKNN
jgi:hypothetical protein